MDALVEIREEHRGWVEAAAVVSAAPVERAAASAAALMAVATDIGRVGLAMAAFTSGVASLVLLWSNESLFVGCAYY